MTPHTYIAYSRRSLFTTFSKAILVHVTIHVQYYTKQNVTRGIHTTYITGKSTTIYGHSIQQELMNTIRLFNKYMLRGEGINVILNICF